MKLILKSEKFFAEQISLHYDFILDLESFDNDFEFFSIIGF